jgi:hypothetical protein
VTSPRFLGPLDLRLYGKRKWITLAAFSYESAQYPKRITIPAEFVTDLASVPRAPVAYLLTAERAPAPAVLHDWLYQHPMWTDRGLADAIFLEAAGCSQPEFGIEAEPGLIRYLMYGGIWAGGWKAWRDDKRRARLNPIWSREGWPEAP